MDITGTFQGQCRPGDKIPIAAPICLVTLLFFFLFLFFLPQSILSQKVRKKHLKNLFLSGSLLEVKLDSHKGSAQATVGLSRSSWYLNESSAADMLIHFSDWRAKVSADKMSRKINPG